MQQGIDERRADALVAGDQIPHHYAIRATIAFTNRLDYAVGAYVQPARPPVVIRTQHGSEWLQPKVEELGESNGQANARNEAGNWNCAVWA